MTEPTVDTVPLVDRLKIEGWQDHLLIIVIGFVGLVLLVALLRGGKS